MKRILFVLIVMILLNSGFSFAQIRFLNSDRLLSNFDSKIELRELREYMIKNIYNLDEEKASSTVYKYIVLLRQKKIVTEEELNKNIKKTDLGNISEIIRSTNLNLISNKEIKLKISEIIQDGYYIDLRQDSLVLGIDYSKLQVYNYYLDDELKRYLNLFIREGQRPFNECGSFSISEYEFASRLIDEYEFYYSSSEYCDEELRKLINSRFEILNKGLKNYPLINKDGYINEYYNNVYKILLEKSNNNILKDFSDKILKTINSDGSIDNKSMDVLYQGIYLY